MNVDHLRVKGHNMKMTQIQTIDFNEFFRFFWFLTKFAFLNFKINFVADVDGDFVTTLAEPSRSARRPRRRAGHDHHGQLSTTSPRPSRSPPRPSRSPRRLLGDPDGEFFARPRGEHDGDCSRGSRSFYYRGTRGKKLWFPRSNLSFYNGIYLHDPVRGAEKM